MNIGALEKVRDHLQVVSVYPTQIQLKVATKAFPFNTISSTPSFTRFQWSCIEQNNIVLTPSGGEGPTQYIVTFVVRAFTEIAAMAGNLPLSEDVPIPEESSIAKIDIHLAIDYVADVDPATMDPAGMLEFVKHNLPYHFWPYWREITQSLALRARLPLPSLPPYHVPAAARPPKSEPSIN